MLRVARIVIPNCPHHVTQRGNNRQDVFFVDDDRASYLGLSSGGGGAVWLGGGGLLPDEQPHPLDRDAEVGGRFGEGAGAGALSVCPVYQSPARPQRPPLAKPLLLLRVGRRPLLEGDGLRGAEPRASPPGPLPVALCVVQRGSPLRAGTGSVRPVGPSRLGKFTCGAGDGSRRWPNCFHQRRSPRYG